MTAARAISAQLVDIRNVGTHKVVKLTIHVPEEQALRITELFGWPTGGHPVPVALARLTEGGEQAAATAQPQSPEPRPSEQVPALKPGGAELDIPDFLDRRPFNTLPYPQQAALRCNDPIFRAFLREELGKSLAQDQDGAAKAVRSICGVKSRSEIQPDTPAGKRWEFIKSGFDAWRMKERVA